VPSKCGPPENHAIYVEELLKFFRGKEAAVKAWDSSGLPVFT